jgi:hypothetical protein
VAWPFKVTPFLLSHYVKRFRIVFLDGTTKRQKQSCFICFFVLRMCNNKVFRRIFGSKKGEVIKGLGEFHNCDPLRPAVT